MAPHTHTGAVSRYLASPSILPSVLTGKLEKESAGDPQTSGRIPSPTQIAGSALTSRNVLQSTRDLSMCQLIPRFCEMMHLDGSFPQFLV